MTSTPKTVKGTRDLLPPETAVWAAVEEVARRVFVRYGYGEIRTPVLEQTELFVRGVGESTDIVGKEMYTFLDKSGRSVTMRPENTAPVARAVVEHRLGQPPGRPMPLKLFYVGPQFRYERPQKGRYRQFHQIGAELIGDPGPDSDVELLLMLVRFLGELGFENLVVLVNTVGDEASRAAYRAALGAYLSPLADRLGEDSRRRLDTNPLRILDTKDPAERELLAGAPLLLDSLSEGSRHHFTGVLAGLERFGVPHRVESRLVRGLDYYMQTVFEIVAEGLGAQDAIVGGGRYDGLIANLGGAEVPGIGFAIGEDRLIDVLPEAFRRRVLARPPVALVPAGGVRAADLTPLAESLRTAGLPAVQAFAGRSLKSALGWAEKLGARHVAILGDEELAASPPEVTLKDLRSGEQRRLRQEEAVAWLAGRHEGHEEEERA